MRTSTVIGVAFLGVAILLGICAVAGVGMKNAYQNATPRINPGDSALAFGAAAAVAFAITIIAAKAIPVIGRVALSLFLFAVAAWLAFSAWIWAVMVG